MQNLGNPNPSPGTEHPIIQESSIIKLRSQLPSSPGNHCSDFSLPWTILHVLELHRNDILQHKATEAWLPSLSIMFPDSSMLHVYQWVTAFYCGIVFRCMTLPVGLFVLLMDTWADCVCWLVWISYFGYSHTGFLQTYFHFCWVWICRSRIAGLGSVHVLSFVRNTRPFPKVAGLLSTLTAGPCTCSPTFGLTSLYKLNHSGVCVAVQVISMSF